MIWRTIGRLVVVPVAFFIAALTACALILTLGLERLTQAIHGPIDDGQIANVMLDLLAQAGTLLPALTLIPALMIVIIGEVARIRSRLYYIVGGGAALAAIPLLARLGPIGAAAATPDNAIWLVFATAGFAGGAVYWLIAGRSA